MPSAVTLRSEELGDGAHVEQAGGRTCSGGRSSLCLMILWMDCVKKALTVSRRLGSTRRRRVRRKGNITAGGAQRRVSLCVPSHRHHSPRHCDEPRQRAPLYCRSSVHVYQHFMEMIVYTCISSCIYSLLYFHLQICTSNFFVFYFIFISFHLERVTYYSQGE